MLSRIKAILAGYGYAIYSKPYQLNIVGLRSKTVQSNRFDDEMHVFYLTPEGHWNYHTYPITTDPGTFWLNNPSYPQGTAILAQGQYENAYAIGLHKEAYKALTQAKPVKVIRDYDRDTVLDFNNGQSQTGIFGINIHRAEKSGTTSYINKYSAGCQVFQNAEDFAEFMQICERHKALHGNAFTYTLVDFRAMRKITLRRILAATTVAAGLMLGWVFKNDLTDLV